MSEPRRALSIHGCLVLSRGHRGPSFVQTPARPRVVPHAHVSSYDSLSTQGQSDGKRRPDAPVGVQRQVRLQLFHRHPARLRASLAAHRALLPAAETSRAFQAQGSDEGHGQHGRHSPAAARRSASSDNHHGDFCFFLEFLFFSKNSRPKQLPAVGMQKAVSASAGMRAQHAMGLSTSTMRWPRWDGTLLARRLMSAQHGTDPQKFFL
jgi:hypothetical protein